MGPTRQDINEMRETLAAVRDICREEPSEKTRADLGRALKRLSARLARAGEHDEAIALTREAVAIWADLERERAHFLGRLELAGLLAASEQFDEACALLSELSATLDTEAGQTYEDFFYEVQANCHIAMARRALAQALAIRKARGNARHIASTEAMLSSLPPANRGDED